MTAVPILAVERRWVCPNCDEQSVTRRADVHTQMHTCRGLLGLTAPMVPAGTAAKTEAVERGDYIGEDDVQVAPADGRPYMSVITTRDEGTDVAVFAPVATASTD